MYENLWIFHNFVAPYYGVKRKKVKKVENDEEKAKKEFEREQMLEQVHQLELQKNYEYDEKIEESSD